MGKSVNKWIGLGNVGKDPDIRATSGGSTVANLSIACTDRRKDAQGNWQDFTEWVPLVAFGRTAEIVRDYAKKGSKLYVEGKIQTRSWEKDGQKHYRTEILVNELVLLDGGGQKRDNGYSPFNQQEPAAEVEDPDCPF